jgi:membrane-associated protease RseP (regulator of RpoE activity)
MRLTSKMIVCALAAVLVTATSSSVCLAQSDAALPNVNTGQTPPVIHIHHHHYYAPYGSYSRAAGLESGYSANTAFQYGFQPGLGNFYSPTKVNWGNLGFFGAFDQNSQHDGLWVLRVLTRSPAARFGLMPGDYIMKINGKEIESYRQLRAALKESAKKPDISTFTVWDPDTKMNVTLKANFGDGE